jgi:hypothetical protein
MVARGTMNSSDIGFAIRHLFPQLPGDSKVHLKSHIGQCDWTFPQVDNVWWVAKLCGPELPGGL